MVRKTSLTPDAAAETCSAIGVECLAFAARRTANVISRAYAARLAPFGLEPSQFGVLVVVAAGRADSARELADRLSIERSTLTRNLTRLLEADLLVGAPGKGRRITYSLTAAGHAKLAEALPAWRAAQDALQAQLAPGSAERARASLAELRGAAKEMLTAD
ncbi:MarR family winged helix-turn-helix transcriptional regulator [Roseococcus pinisoli]|uniref:Winged helix-turn-helix transcriptional regulator n=1 Tax=Roseococcus pinisoli TaxID=2835040 RepID=A0ABS5QCE1_9PROT|nr:MarR family winged helix-turn-helix transcriptional regulator [Roseococcus pinisoli]MBS7810635.1 winged helix-turn-helix transcriptional regulator [Roseococcus pinisoli]